MGMGVKPVLDGFEFSERVYLEKVKGKKRQEKGESEEGKFP